MKTSRFIKLLIVIVVLSFVSGNVKAQQRSITLIPGTMEVPTPIVTAITTALNNAQDIIQGDFFAVTDDTTLSNDWHRISLIGLENIGSDYSWNLDDNGVWIGLALVHRKNNQWTAGIRGTRQFSSLLQQVPDNIMDAQTKFSLDPLTARTTTNETPHLPFMGGKKLLYGERGIHPDGASAFAGYQSTDLIRQQNQTALLPPNEALASLSGHVTWVCQTPNSYQQIAIQIGPYMYRHIKRNPWLLSQTYIYQGQRLGELIKGNIPTGTPCGWASQQNTTSHLHFVFPTSSFTPDNPIDGYYINQNNQWADPSHKVMSTKTSFFVSQNASNECEMFQSDGITLFEHKDCSGRLARFTAPGKYKLEDIAFSDITSSIDVDPNWSVFAKDDTSPFGTGSICITQDKWDLSRDLYTSGGSLIINDTISEITVFQDPHCGLPPICSIRNSDTINSTNCATPTPTATPPPGSTPTATPSSNPPPTAKWEITFYSSENECNFPNCNPTTSYIHTTMDGTGVNISFSDGKALGQGNDHWGSIWKQTINFPSGNYVFHANHDDGLKIFIGQTNIMDVGVSEDNNATCPARYLSGPTEITLIWRNSGGPAHLNFWTDQDDSACTPPPPTATPQTGPTNIWLWRDANSTTRITVENGNPDLTVRFGRTGQPVEVTTPHWYPTTTATNGYEFVLPDDVISVLVNTDIIPIIGTDHQPEWKNSSDDPHWAIRKQLKIWINSAGQTKLTYLHHTTPLPTIHYYIDGQEQTTTSLWEILPDSLEATIPDNAQSFHTDAWIIPKIEGVANNNWRLDNFWIIKKPIIVTLEPDNTTKVTYQNGSPVPVQIGYYNQSLQTTTALWKQNGNDYYFIVPSTANSFHVTTGPTPSLDYWSSFNWGHYQADPHWIQQKTVWIYKGNNQKTLFRYNNTQIDPADVTIYYYLSADSAQHTTTDLWYPVSDGIEFIVPDNAESVLINRGPIPIITDSATQEWFPATEDRHWSVRKFVRVWMDNQTTYVTYWHHQNPVPTFRYWKDNQEIVTTTLWKPVNDGIQLAVPSGVSAFKIDAWILPEITSTAQDLWEILSINDPWVSLKPPPPINYNHKIYLPIVINK